MGVKYNHTSKKPNSGGWEWASQMADLGFKSCQK